MLYTQFKNGIVEGFALIKEVEKKVNVKNVPYLNFTLCDKTGEMNAKLWDYKEEIHGEYSPDDCIKYRGQISQYNGQDQLRIDKIRPILSDDNVDMSQLIPSADYDSEAMYSEITRLISSLKDEELKRLTLSLLEKYKEKLLFWPAAFKLHHAMRGGLLYHTLSIMKMAEFTSSVYPSVDRDLLLSGCALHDIAKIHEYSAAPTGLAKSYSVKGNLLGHLVMGAMEIENECRSLGICEEKAVLLEHMLISHHGEPEFGAAVRPMFLEAEILCQLDTLDATVYEIEQAVSEVQVNDFTQRQWALDNRKLYNHGRKPISTTANLLNK